MRKNTWFFGILSGLLLLAGVPPLSLWWISCLGLFPLFFLFFDPAGRLKDISFGSLLAGGIYFGIGLYWLLFYELRIYILALLVLVPAFVIYFSLLWVLTRSFKIASIKILIAAILWFAFQKIYSLTPLGTSGIEAPFYGSLPLMQIAVFGGFGTLSALLIGFSAGIAAFLKERKLLNGICALLFAALLLGAYFWGEHRLKMEDSLNLRVTLIQHNLSISGKWNFDHPEEIRKKYRELALEASKRKPDLIVFPLYNFPGDPLRKPDFFTALARETGSPILIATYIPEKEGETLSKGFYDTAILYSPNGKVSGKYQAIQPPPFRQISEKTGKEYHLLETLFGKIGVLLCYEDATPRIAMLAVKKGAAFLVALSNPGHFISTHLPYYHLMQDRLRAIETGRFVLRVSANGYSAIIDPKGRLLQRSALNQEIILQAKN